MDVRSYAERQLGSVAARAQTDELAFEEAFVNEVLEVLVSAGECEDPHPCLHESRGLKISAYDLRDDAGTVDIYVAQYNNLKALERVQSHIVRRAFDRVQRFFQSARRGHASKLSPAHPGHELARRVEGLKTVELVRCIFITNGELPKMRTRTDEELGIKYSFHAWGITELYRMAMQDRPPEDFEVKFYDHEGEPGLPAVKLPGSSGAVDTYLAVVPATLLKSLYDKHGLRLLESNVRTYLRGLGKVNSGIQATARDEPHMFFAYNNGITATATELVTTAVTGGTCRLVSGTNLQIVNGGQTTASLHNAAVQRNISLDGIYVQMKLSRIEEDANTQSIVRKISRFANTQNKVQPSDLESNHPFHIRLEQLSRQIWAPTALVAGAVNARWYYERARGQYANAIAREKTPARQRTFKAQNPKNQKIVKTALAKFVNTWDRLPNKVSYGGEKNFGTMMLRLEAHGPELPDEHWFKDMVAKAILFKGCDRVVGRSKIKGHKSFIVTYSVAWLVHLTDGRVDLNRIWKEQNISGDLEGWFAEVTEQVREYLLDAPASSSNVSDWAKKEVCWAGLKELVPVRQPPESALKPATAVRTPGEPNSLPANG